MVLSSAKLDIVQQASAVLNQDVVYLDTETTGLTMNDEIIEVALINSAGEELFNKYVKPTQPIPQSAINIHGISNNMVKDALPWPLVWQMLKNLLAGKVVAIYNNEFDLRMMAQSHRKYGFAWNERINTFDVMRCYSRFKGEWNPIKRSYNLFKLMDACRNMGITVANAHRAIDDVQLTRALLIAIAKS